MRVASRSLYVLAATAVVCSALCAQESLSSPAAPVVPRLVNFSGIAVDGQGKAISGIAGVTFAIYKEQYEGSPLWLETQNVQADGKGNYTVQLGATKPQGLPLDLFTGGDARWLGVTVNGGKEQARVLLLSVPYALKASDAETLGGLPPSAFVLSQGVQGTSTKTAPARSNAASGNSVAAPNGTVTGVGVAGFIPMWDTTTDIVDSVLFQKTSQIGVKTTTPAATLDVNGKTDVRNTLTLFPNGTNSTLAVNGTNFKVDQTGKVTFISGQTFPGTGTVTSVGLSAPSSDFTVSGSPVTKSGTLSLKWAIAPTNADTANAIVKRDSTGSFAANTITAGVVSASFLGATNTSGAAINGTSTGTSGGSDGVDGVSTSGTASGVAGINNATGGIGVYGSGPNGDSFYADSNVQQARAAGGWVKAMALVIPTTGIMRCFNSALAGAAATSPPCNFLFTYLSPGQYVIDFGFEVDDRFLALTPQDIPVWDSLCTSLVGCPITPNQVQVGIYCYGGGFPYFCDSTFYLIVY